ncbi:MFS transporter [Thermogemmatispora carboxidivorans]|uniref:MFS transporter n=1 Tax=Thermogemmatispora carboxidivorans TaxID=1382306 RepID=UPI00069B3CF8|nr:MFS transporter [Thermogemmatispora carboxidivorans]
MRVLINRNFALLWLGQAISNLGDVILGAALVLWIANDLGRGRSWAPVGVSGVFIAEYAPVALIGPPAGVFVDRWSRRLTMLRTDGLRMALTGCLAWVLSPTVPFFGALELPLGWQLGAVYTVVLLDQSCGQFFNPARLALIGDIVEPEDLARATSLSQATMGLSVIVGPAIGSLLVFNVGIQWAVITDALSFGISFLTIALIRAPVEKRLESDPISFSQDFRAGLGVLFGSRGLLAILLASLLSMSAFGALNALAIFFVTDNLHAQPNLYGPLGTVLGLGAIAGALIAGLVANRLGLPRLLWGATFALGLTTLLLARMTSVGPAFGLIFLVGATWIAVNVAVEPLVLRLTAREFVGRVTAVLTPAGSLASVLSAALAGSLVSTVLHDFRGTVLGLAVGPVDTFFCGIGALVLLGSAAVRLLMHDVRLLDEQPKPETPRLASTSGDQTEAHDG